ncbi:MAG: sel1 repeat family protein [Prosthecochloris sp.]|nr:sel1 repeat family protein [Prosthecochloris sp.]
MKNLLISILAALALLIPATSYTQTPAQQDVAELISMAESGNVGAQYTIGLKYDNGRGVKQDKRKEKEWFGKACDNGSQMGCDNYRKLNEQGY